MLGFPEFCYLQRNRPPKKRSCGAENVDRMSIDQECRMQDKKESLQNTPSDTTADKLKGQNADKKTSAKDGTSKDSSGGEKETAVVAVRTSSRLSKRPRREFSPPPSPPKRIGREPKASTGTPETKARRWELWTKEDKDTFFEGLYQHGKDFDAIHNLIAQKSKKKGVPESLIKNREQVRYFYYRTWNKIAKHIDLNDNNVNKHTLELYGLINYGEMRKKVGGSVEKCAPKLNELIDKGHTTVKVGKKGKVHRLKTPVCRALKKLHNVEAENKGDIERPKLPDHIVVELRPKTNYAWNQVQEISQNPCVRVKLTPQKRLSTIIQFLNKKWKPHRLRLRESLKAAEEKQDKELKLSLPATTDLVPCRIETVGIQPRPDLALSNLRDEAKGAEVQVTDKKASTQEEGQPHSDDSGHSREDAGDAAGKLKEERPAETTEAPPFEFGRQLSSGSDCGTFLSFNGVLGTDLLEADDLLPGVNDINANDIQSDMKEADLAEQEKRNIDSAKLLEKYQQGWTLESGKKVTLGELWLVTDSPEQLVMEYEWVDRSPSIAAMQQNLANMLRRLVHLATTEFTDFSRQLQPTVSSPTKCCQCGAEKNKGSPPVKSGTSKSPRGGRSPAPRSIRAQPVVTTAGVINQPATDVINAVPATASTSQVDGVETAVTTADGVFRIPTTPVRLVKDGFPPVQHLTNLQKQTNPPFMRKKPRRMMQNSRRPMVMQRTLLPKAQIIPRTIVGLTLGKTNPDMPHGASFLPVLTPGVNQRNSPIVSVPGHVIKTVSTCTDTSVRRTVLTSRLSPSSTGLVTVRQLVPSSAAEKPTTADTIQQNSVTSTNILKAAVTEAGIMEPDSAGTDTPNMADVAGTAENASSSTAVTATTSPSASPPNISSLLDISLPPPAPDDNSDKLLDISLGNSSSSFSELFRPAVDKEHEQDSVLETPALNKEGTTSPTSSLKMPSLPTEAPWDELSLSHLLESPLKKPPESSSVTCLPSFNENTTDSLISKFDQSQVDNTLHCMMTESSIDYVSKFADLAAQIAAAENENKEQMVTSI